MRNKYVIAVGGLTHLMVVVVATRIEKQEITRAI